MKRFILFLILVMFVGTAWASTIVTVTASAQNTFTDAISPSYTITGAGPGGVYPLNITISGISGDTVTLQRSFDSGSTWYDVQSYTEDAENVAEEVERGVTYRIGVKTGDYSAGTVVLRLARP